MISRLETLEAVERGSLSHVEAAAVLGTSVERVLTSLEGLELSRELARRDLAHARRVRRGGLALAFGAGLVLGVIGLSAPAVAQVVCAQTLPSPLTTFCPDTPALASQVNGNFQGLVNMLTAKAGPLSAPNAVTTSGLTVNGPSALGATSVTSGALDFGQRGGSLVNLFSPSYALGVQNSTLWYRSDNHFAWFRGGTSAQNTFDPGAGGALSMSLDSGGNLSVGGQIAGGSIRQGTCAWGTPGPGPLADNQVHTMLCPAGRYMAGFRCYAQTYLDGDCAAYCCTP